MIIIKEKVKDFPTLIFLMIFDFWAGTVCGPKWPNSGMDEHKMTYTLATEFFLGVIPMGKL